jgi:hypothetical protein
VSMSQLMGSKAAANTRLDRERSEFAAHSGRRPCSAAGRAVKDADSGPTGSSRRCPIQPSRCSNPQSSIPTSRRLSFFPCYAESRLMPSRP